MIVSNLLPSVSDMEQLYDAKKAWVHYLTRPFDLFGASLWHLWYFSSVAKQSLGVEMPDVLFIEEHENVVRHYRVHEQFEMFKATMAHLAAKDTEAFYEDLKRGTELNACAQHLLQHPHEIKDLSEAIELLIEVTAYATIIPYWGYTFAVEAGVGTPEMLKLAESLRATSFYPRLVEEIVMPLAKAKLGAHAALLPFMTIQELLVGDVSQAAGRQVQHDAGKRFVYQSLAGAETISWIDDPKPLIKVIEHLPDAASEIKGRSAWPGCVQGTARVVLSHDGKDATFNEGDILVSISSNPNLMPLIQKSAAIVTDEGGVTCHAAIIARELRKPCIIGTKHATSIVKDGDRIEVNADTGIVTILK